MHNVINKYKAAYHNVNKTRQIILLYEAMIRYLKKAKLAASEFNIQERYNNLDKTTQIITGLVNCLDYSKGSEIAILLEQFYDSLYLRIMSLHHNVELELYDHLINEIQLMLESWQQVDESATLSNNNNSNQV